MYYKYRTFKFNEGLNQIFSAEATKLVHKMAPVEEEVESPVCHLVIKFNIRLWYIILM